MRLALALWLAAAPGLADEMFDPAPVEACLAAAAGAGARLDCIGVAAKACWQGEGSSAPIVVGPCLGAENAYWEARVGAAMAALRARAKAKDSDYRDLGWPDNVLESLDKSQATWEAYRAAACDFVTADWGRGSGSGPAWMDCVMRRTAGHALWLEKRLAHD